MSDMHVLNMTILLKHDEQHDDLWIINSEIPAHSITEKLAQLVIYVNVSPIESN